MLLPCSRKRGFFNMVGGVYPGAQFGEPPCFSDPMFLLKPQSYAWRTAMLLRPHFPTTRA